MNTEEKQYFRTFSTGMESQAGFSNLTDEEVEEAVKLFLMRMDRGSDILLMGPLFSMISDKAEALYRLFPSHGNPAWLPWVDAIQRLYCAANELAMLVKYQDCWMSE